jgi:hypothetical protein
VFDDGVGVTAVRVAVRPAQAAAQAAATPTRTRTRSGRGDNMMRKYLILRYGSTMLACRRWGAAPWALGLVLVFPAEGLAEPVDADLYGIFAAGGEAEFDLEGGSSVDDDVLPTFGAGTNLSYALHRFFALGGSARFSWWNTDVLEDEDIGRHLLVDLGLVPRVRFDIETVDLLLFFSVPFGLAVSLLDSEVEDIPEVAAVGAEVETGIGYHFGLLFGIRVPRRSTIGAFFELGYVYHHVTNSLQLGGREIDLDIDFGQLAVHGGIAIGF